MSLLPNCKDFKSKNWTIPLFTEPHISVTTHTLWNVHGWQYGPTMVLQHTFENWGFSRANFQPLQQPKRNSCQSSLKFKRNSAPSVHMTKSMEQGSVHVPHLHMEPNRRHITWPNKNGRPGAWKFCVVGIKPRCGSVGCLWWFVMRNNNLSVLIRQFGDVNI